MFFLGGTLIHMNLYKVCRLFFFKPFKFFEVSLHRTFICKCRKLCIYPTHSIANGQFVLQYQVVVVFFFGGYTSTHEFV